MNSKSGPKPTARRFHPLRTLQARLLLALSVVAILPIGVVGLSGAALARQAIAEQSADELAGLARGLANHLDLYLVVLLSDTHAVAGLPQITSMDPAQQEPVLKELFQQLSQFTRLSTFDRSGGLLASSHPGGIPPIASRSAFQTAIRGRQGWEVDVELSAGRPSLLVVTPIRGANREVLGALGTVVDLESLSTVVGRVHSGGNGQAFVLDAAGRVLLHPEQAAIRGQLDYSSLGVPTGGRPAGVGTARYTLDGVICLGGYAPVPSMGWVVVVQRPESEVLAPAERLWNIALGGIAIAALLGAVVAILLARQLTRPVRQLVSAASAFGAGDPSAPLPTGVSRDSEIGALVNTFAAMRQQVVARGEQLRQSQKMEAVGVLAGGVAHDFNNLLTAILGFANLLLAEPDPAARQRYTEEILKAGERARSLTGQLLAFSRQQVLQPEVVDLNTVVADTEALLRRVLGEDIELRTTQAPEVGRVKVDRDQMAQVLVNLAVNARDAMPLGGKLTIETANAELAEIDPTDDGGVRAGPCVMLAVSDTGSGMDRETQKRIFEPSFTTKQRGKGTGLGLSTVYGIVSQSAGDIRVYSEPGRGTTFKLYLPRCDETPNGSDARESSSTMPRGSETLLLVEDEDAVRELARVVLRDLGYRVLEAGEPGEALRASQEHTGPIHLLVTDVVMPGMSGGALAEALASLRPETKVLYMSGYTADVAVRHGVLATSTSYLQKPFAPMDLARKVRQVLDGAG